MTLSPICKVDLVNNNNNTIFTKGEQRYRDLFCLFDNLKQCFSKQQELGKAEKHKKFTFLRTFALFQHIVNPNLGS